MKKYAVTVETEVNFKFFPHVDKDELLKEFSETICEMDMENLERFIARRIAVGNTNFIEGIGSITPKWMGITDHGAHSSDFVLEYDIEINGTETEKL